MPVQPSDRHSGGRRPVMPRLLAAAAALCGLSACAGSTAECDPAKAGFFSGISGAASGCYDQRIDERQQQLAAAQAASDALRAEAARNEAAAGQQEAEIESLETQLAALDSNMAKLNTRLAAAKSRAQVDRRRLAETERKMAALQAERRQFALHQTAGTPSAATTTRAPTSDEQKIKDMNLRTQQLWQELDALVGVEPELQMRELRLSPR